MYVCVEEVQVDLSIGAKNYSFKCHIKILYYYKSFNFKNFRRFVLG